MKLQDKMRTIFQGLAAVTVGITTCILLLVFAFNAFIAHLTWYKLLEHGRQAKAVITAREPKNHQTCHFAYTINSERYTGADEACYFAIGQNVSVTYLPSDPSFATTASPSAEIFSYTFASFIVSVVAGIGAAKIYMRYIKKDSQI